MPMPLCHTICVYVGTAASIPMEWRELVGDEYEPIDLTNWTARMQIRTARGVDPPIITLTTDPDDGITLGGALGTIDVSVLIEELPEGLTWPDDGIINGVWDLCLISPSDESQCIVGGPATVKQNVTEPEEP